MAFKDIKGQEQAVDFMRRSVNKHRLAHAYLFTGPEGLGKTLFALTLAKFLNCDDPVKIEDAVVDCCERCVSCRKINDHNHPDVHWIEAGAKAKSISINEIRLMQKDISLKPYEARFKIFVILQAQLMTEEAANSLLKTLEEPPDFCVIALTTAESRDLLPTIQSRCQIIKFYPLEQQRLRKILAEDFAIDPEKTDFLSAQAEGRIGNALNLKDQDVLGGKNRVIDYISKADRRLSTQTIFELKDKKKLVVQLRFLLNWFRDIVFYKAGMASYIINVDRYESIKSQARFYTFTQLEQIIESIVRTYRSIEQNVNPKIALEVMREGIIQCSTK
ncbi:MAG: DNA polymerase III subunit delta' [Candidatus Omnitrophica bacterium]|nr:DNA polymerase III subunit delta' [Candidatus Omnitrophota bacterium]